MALPRPKLAEGTSNAIDLEASELSEAAETAGITVRFIGSLAINHHCPHLRPYLDRLDRRPAHDIDVVVRSSEERTLRGLLEARSYTIDRDVEMGREFGINRLVFLHDISGTKLCVFPDKIDMAHEIDLSKRLECDDPTVSVADLLLSKLQIVDITANDIKDMIVLLGEHEIGGSDNDMINGPYLAQVTAAKWGLWYTSEENLRLTRDAVTRFEVLPEPLVERVRERAEALRHRMAAEPKSLGWRIRAMIGTRLRWFTEVEDLDREDHLVGDQAIGAG